MPKKDWPWPGCGKEFEDWFDQAFEFGFGMKWMKPIAKKFAAAGWDAGILNNIVGKTERSMKIPEKHDAQESPPLRNQGQEEG